MTSIKNINSPELEKLTGRIKETLDISIVIPMYNEEDVIEELCSRLTKVLESTNKKYEIIFVEDGRKDETLSKLIEMQQKYECIKVIKLRGNFGQTPALAAGFDHASGEIIIGMDGDLQHLPEDIPRFLDKIDIEGYDVVSGWRADTSTMTLLLLSQCTRCTAAPGSGCMRKETGLSPTGKWLTS